jgi:protein-tyrosine phosphatase
LKALARKRKFGAKVFIYCESGVSRSPTVAMAYICLFKKLKQWPSVDGVRDLIKI